MLIAICKQGKSLLFKVLAVKMLLYVSAAIKT